MKIKSAEEISIEAGKDKVLHRWSKEGIFSYLNLTANSPEIKLVFTFGGERSVLPTLKKLYNSYFNNQLNVGDEFFLYRYDSSADIYSLIFGEKIYAKEGDEVKVYNASDTEVSISYLLRSAKKRPRVKATAEYGW